MTLRTLVVCASPLSGSHTVRDHLAATNCDDLGSGGGGDVYINSTIYELSEEPVVGIEAVGDIITLTEIDDRIEIVEVEVILEEQNDAIY